MPLDLQNCYRILQLPAEASIDQLKFAYREQVKTWHPDRFWGDESMRHRCEEKLKMITEAFRTVEAALAKATGLGDVSAFDPSRFRSSASQTRLDPIQVGGRWGFVDPGGRIRIPAIYETVQDFSEGLAAVCQNRAYGYIDSTGATVIDFQFSDARSFTGDRALAAFGRYGFIDQRGNWVVQPRYQAGLDFSEGVGALKLDGKWGFVESNGDWLVTPRFDEVQSFQAGRAFARQGALTVIVQRNGRVRAL